MKIIILNGSNRKNGATALILNEIYKILQKHSDLEIEFFNVSDLNLKYCIGCGKCYKIGKCVFEDNIEKLSIKMGEADGIILGSPTYASNVSAQMKVIIDRGHFVIEQLLYIKYAISVATYENYCGKNTSKVLNILLSYSRAKISGSIISKTPFSSNPLNNNKLKNSIHKITNNFYNDISKQKKYPFQNIKHFFIFKMGILPFVMKKGNEYNSVIKHWKKEK